MRAQAEMGQAEQAEAAFQGPIYKAGDAGRVRDGAGVWWFGTILTQQVIDGACPDLVVVEGRMAVRSVGTARLLAERYLATDQANWSNPAGLLLSELTARAGLERGVLAEDDLWG